MYRLRSRNSVLEVVVTHFKLSIPDPSPLLTLSTPTVTDNTENTTIASTTATSSIVNAAGDDSYSEDSSIYPVSVPAAVVFPAGEVGGDRVASDPSPSFSTPASTTLTPTPIDSTATATAPITNKDNRVYTQIASSATPTPTIPNGSSSPSQGSDNPIQSLYTTPTAYTPLTSRRTPNTSPSSSTTSSTNNYPITTTTTKPAPDAESLISHSSSSNTDRPILLFKSTQERERDIITDTTYTLDTSDAFNPYRKRAPVPGSLSSHTRVSTTTGTYCLLIIMLTYIYNNHIYLPHIYIYFNIFIITIYIHATYTTYI